ncbi:hypothetical protein ADIARSV_0215 [Arcticibacter svalbardensis MN12-7]|uniref:Outer membrane protein beta-barrel domain-containing protein n=1 Tax=Arcticibacter svalbardensis MN12-7 TaxID=1150600 RepID=R9H5Z7_9SPHI|nr:hypothetical protein ADIARSV_0215 [Arcticibacter svalbardensis MN12-7]
MLSSSSAQNTYRHFSIGIGAGQTSTFTDFLHADRKLFGYGVFDYYFSPYLNIGMEAQSGSISGHDDQNTSNFQGDFQSLTFKGKLHVGELIRKPQRYIAARASIGDKLVKGIYLGSGGGVFMIMNGINSSESYNNKELFIPALGGIDMYMGAESRLLLNLNYQTNFLLGDKMDGSIRPGSHNDLYQTISIGISYTLGKLTYL